MISQAQFERRVPLSPPFNHRLMAALVWNLGAWLTIVGLATRALD